MPFSDHNIRIKARVEPGETRCTFLIDRMLIDQGSAYFDDPKTAAASPLAQRLFGVSGVDAVLIAGAAVVVTRVPDARIPWQSLALELGGAIREHLQRGLTIVSKAYFDALPSPDEIRARVEEMLETQINPAIAGHSGSISVESVDRNTVYLEMHGGCQGCAASAMTLRQGVEETLRQAVPGIGAILDITDHAAGENPYYPRKTLRTQNHHAQT